VAYTHKREHPRAIESTNKQETRARRIEKAIAMLKDPESTGAPQVRQDSSKQSPPRSRELHNRPGAKGAGHRLS
jgi:hypothetical protein